MALTITRKTRTTLLIILGVLFVAGGGLLIWRVTREDTVAPTDSDAGDSGCKCCVKTYGCAGTGKVCAPIECIEDGGGCSTQSSCPSKKNKSDCEALGCFWNGEECFAGTCVPSVDDCSSTTCEWPEVSFDKGGSSYCATCASEDSCDGNPPRCTPPACPDGEVDCGRSGDGAALDGCYKYKSCCDFHDDCGNPYKVYRYCKTAPTVACESMNPKTVTLKEGESVTLNVKVSNGQADAFGYFFYNKEEPNDPLIKYPDSETDYFIYDSGTLKSEDQQTFTYDQIFVEDQATGQIPDHVQINAKLHLGAAKSPMVVDCVTQVYREDSPEPPIQLACFDTGCNEDDRYCPSQYECMDNRCVNPECPEDSDCVCPIPQDPTFSINKTGVEQCIVGGSETYAEAIYTITVENTSTVAGTLDKVVDDLDDSVLEEYISEISSGGVYSAGTITWDLTGSDETMQPGDILTFTYKLTIPESAFGLIENIATAYTEIGNITDDENIDMDCDIPEWTVEKSAVEECIEDDDVYAKATYTITVTNTSEFEGRIDRIEDELDSKVLGSYINNISDGGTYNDGKIIWDLEGEEEIFAPGESRDFTYYLEIPESAFGTYENLAIVYPHGSEELEDSENIVLDCEIVPNNTVPQTGIFDTVLSRIILGIVLILIGANWGNITKLNYTLREFLSDQRMKHFERKVVKDE